MISRSLSGLLLAILFIVTTLSCDQVANDTSPAKLRRVPFKSKINSQEREYFLYLPQGYASNPQKEYPVLLFLHGNGERGDGKKELDYVMKYGPLYEAWVMKRDLPFIIIAPQLPMFGMDKKGIDYIDNRQESSIPRRQEEGTPERWKGFGRPTIPMTGVASADTFPNGMITLPVGWEMVAKDLVAILDQVHQDFRGDKKRTYLTGLSYGGFGTWWMASKYPQLFAAINPVVGWGHPDLMEPIAKFKIPVWAVAGGRDETVPVQYFYPGLNQLEALGHTNVRFTVEEDMGHDAWGRTYGGEDVYQWLLSHKLE